ncbi:MAG: TetR/AcrR family transcriptional regulator [Opitutales bacterium]|nr:TetR/AcrR family transcriptional regulator [Opitutales bacterium]
MSLRSKKSTPPTREKLLDATIRLMRQQGYTATTVDQICAEAAVTKGAFFHYFKTKELIAEAAIGKWCQNRVAGYMADMGMPEDDPLVRLNRLIDGLIESVQQPPDGLIVCLLGMVSQEMAGNNERMRATCSGSLQGWTGLVAQLLQQAKDLHPPKVDFDPQQIAWMLNSLWQGSLLVGKTCDDPKLVAHNFNHIRNYITSLFSLPESHVKN